MYNIAIGIKLISRIFIGLAGIVFASNTYSVTYEDRRFIESVLIADAVVVGNVASVRSFNSYGTPSDEINDLSQIDLFTEITLTKAGVVDHRGFTDIERDVVLYLDGGLIPMPKKLRSKYYGSMFGQGNTAIPISEFQLGERLLLLISGNGKVDVPLVGRFAVTNVTDDRSIEIGGRAIAAFVEGNIIFQSYKMPVVPKESNGPIPPEVLISNSQENGKNVMGVDFEQLIDFIAKTKTGVSNSKDTNIDDELFPVVIASKFSRGR